MAVDIANVPPTAIANVTIGPNVTATPPLIIDGTGLTTAVPLLIKNGKTNSGVEVQVTGTVASGFILNNSSGTAVSAYGLAVSANDWFTSTVAGDAVVALPSGKSLRFGTLAGGATLASLNATLGRLALSDANSSLQLISLDSGAPQVKVILTNQNAKSLSVQAYNASTTILGVTSTNIMEIVAHATAGALLIYGAGSYPFILGANGTERFRMDGTGIGFFVKAPAAQQASGANLTNSVTSGGTDDTIANFTDLTTYATDAAAIRNDIYQLARKLKQINDGLRLYGLLT
jgi:hypothetical protein